jgi:isopenicillin N synthase-like dioxygenase
MTGGSATSDVRILTDFAEAQALAPDEIPVVDFRGFSEGSAARTAVCDEIGRACREIGFFYLVGHGIPDHVTAATFEQIRWYFGLPFATKMELEASTEQYRGYFPAREDTERAGITGGSMEAFRLMLDLSDDDPEVVAGTPLHGANRWPAGNATFRVVMEAYQAAALGVAGQLRRAFAIALGLADDVFEPFFEKPLINLQPAHYRGQPSEDAAEREVGVGEHRDTGAFTLLMQDDVPGLEVQDRTGRWVEATIVPRALVVNIGDSMMSWTNGEFVSTPHRVVNRSTLDRYIVGLFMNPDYHAVVEPMAPFVSPTNPARFAPVHNGEYWWEIAQHAAGGYQRSRASETR